MEQSCCYDKTVQQETKFEWKIENKNKNWWRRFGMSSLAHQPPTTLISSPA